MRILALSLFLLSLGAADLPPSAKPAVDAYDAKVAKLKADFDKALAKETELFAAALAKVQEAETKKGNLDGALAIKAKLEALGGPVKKEPKPLTSAELVEKLQGTHAYLIGASHNGQIEVRKKQVVDTIPGIQGELVVEGGKVFIAWGNGTRWALTSDGDAIRIMASDGAGAFK